MESPMPHATQHGQKRQPDDELEHEQRLSKRFNLLNLEQDGQKLYIPVKSKSLTAAPPSLPQRRRSNAVSESMPVDESKDRVYIHNLDEELADIESDEERLVFLPDIEKHLSQIPKTVLAGDIEPISGQEVVLYRVPESISIPQEQDHVRKAIEETRARALERQTQEVLGGVETERVPPQATAEDDVDAMEIE